MKRFLVSLLLALSFATPAYAARGCEANENLVSPNDAIANINTDLISIGAWIYVDANPATNAAVFATLGSNAAGGGVSTLGVRDPITSGFIFQYQQNTNATNGRWRSDDLSLNTWYHVAVTYDKSSTTNDPVLYVNGTSVTVTESVTPTGTYNAGADTIKFCEDGAGTSDIVSTFFAYVTLDAGVIWDVEQVNRHMRAGRMGGAEVQFPFLTTKLDNDGASGSSLTATGTVVVGTPKLPRAMLVE